MFAKLTWQANPSNDLEAWVEWDRYDIIGRGGDAVTPLEATVTEDAPEYVWNLSWKALLSREHDPQRLVRRLLRLLLPRPAQRLRRRRPARRRHRLLQSRTPPTTTSPTASGTRSSPSISHYADDFIKGDHDFKFGMEIERSTLRSRYGYPTGAWFYDNYDHLDDDPGTEEDEDSTHVSYGYYGYGYDLRGTLERGTLFAQDSWKIAPNFTLNAGVRAEFNRGKVPGEGEVFDNDALAPRLGFAWDPFGDGKHGGQGALRPLLREVRRHPVLLREPGRLHAARDRASSSPAAT